ncbi:MAG: hypothetical protein AAGA67_06965 [Cyanobacteria bacterium P01_F01_bin.153]
MVQTAPAPVFPSVDGLDDLLSQVRESLQAAGDKTHVDGGLSEFEAVRDRVAGDRPEVAAMMTLLWQEAVSARRSCNFWREVSDVEKELANRLAENTQQRH